jgi:ABC-type branched-subunit amino acid transport system substrate-binding protein
MAQRRGTRVALLAWLLVTATARAEDGVSDREILLGSSAAYHGSSAALGVEQWRGFTAYFRRLNAQGGVAGRQIRVIAYDDQYEPLYCVANTLKLLEKDHVFALFGYVGTPTLARALPVLTRFAEHGAFLFSNFTGAQLQREAPYDKMVFNLRASYREETAGLIDHFIKVGYQRFAAFVQDDAYGQSGEDGLQRALAAHKTALVAVARYPRGMRFAESAQAQLVQILAAHPEVVIAVGAYQGCGAFIRDARLGGFGGPIANVSFVGADALLDLLLDFEKKSPRSVTTRLVNSQVVPNWSDPRSPLAQEYRQTMDRLGKELPAVPSATGKVSQPPPRRYSFTSFEGFLDAKLISEILRRAGHDLTRASFRAQAESLGGVDLGLGVPLSFSASNHQALHAVWYTTVKDGRWVELSEWKLK